MSKHTPWAAGMSGPMKDWPEVRDANGTLLARMYGPGAEGNSNLLAAAPDMLEALQAIANDIYDGNNPNALQTVQAIARAAIAKAGG